MMPVELAQGIEALLYGKKQAPMKEIAEKLTQRYRTESGKGARLVQSAEEAVVYSVVRMPATFGAVSAALSYACELLPPRFSVQSVADCGAGTGAAAWAIREAFGPEKITLLEREAAMRSVGQSLMSEDMRSVCEWKPFDVVTDRIEQKYDLVSAAYLLNELAESARGKVLEKLWNATEKILLIVEPGTPVCAAQMQGYRSFLSERGATIVAPCPQSINCPMGEGDWCHFTCRIQRTKMHRLLKGEAPFEDEKYSYIVAVKGDIPVQTVQNRVLRHPYTEKGKVTLTFCNGTAVTEKTFRKGDSEYKTAQKVNCGDAF